MIIQIPDKVNTVIDTLLAAGFEAYAVGGAVRDSIMGREVNDWDITTSALACETKEVFASHKVIDTGIAHGTVTIIIDHEPIEVTTFRIDGEYSDNRHPDSVLFTSSLREDLSRRDFTVNALACNGKTGLVDMFGGENDIKAKIIRCVGVPEKRFHEDGLRIMRALRFSSVLDFSIDPQTANAVHACKELLSNIAAERIAKELSKLICGKGAVRILKEYADVFSFLFPWFTSAVSERTFELIENSLPCDIYRYAILLCRAYADKDERPAAADAFSKALRLSNKDSKRLVNCISFYETELSALTLPELRRFTGIYKAAALLDAAEFQAAFFGRESSEKAKEAINGVVNRADCVNLGMLKIKGEDLLKLGLGGSEIGKTLNLLLESVMRDETENNRSALYERAKNIKNNLNGEIKDD